MVLLAVLFTGCLGIGENKPPVAKISVSDKWIEFGTNVTFDGSNSTDPDGSIVSYTWDFGDSSPRAYTSITVHKFIQEDTKNVTLTVTDNDGASSKASISVFINLPVTELKSESSGLPSDQMRIIVVENDKQNASFDSYRITLYKNYTIIVNATKVRTGLVATGIDSSEVNFTDDGDGKLKAGDSFLLSNLRTSSFYEFNIIYSGSVRAAVQWNT